MVFDFNDFYNSLMVKNQLLTVDINVLKEEYKDMEKYNSFLDTISVITHIDGCFFMLDDSLIDRAETIIGVNRFAVQNNHIRDVIRSIINYFNDLKTQSKDYKNSLLFQYLLYHEDCRKIKINSDRELAENFVYDAIALRAICKDEMDLIKDKDDESFLSSLNYFIEAVPELFENDEVRERVNYKLLDIKNRNIGFFNKTLRKEKETEKNFRNIINKEA